MLYVKHLEDFKMDQIVCLSCKRRITNLKGITRFKCPGCGKAEIIRCGHCKEIVTKYTCPQCGFVGPN